MSFPTFTRKAKTEKLGTIQRSISSGMVGKNVRALEELIALGEDEEAKESLDIVKAWIREKRETVAKCVEAGRAVAAFLEADLLFAALMGHPMQEEIGELRARIQAGKDFKIGDRFFQLRQMLTKASEKERDAALARFARRFPESYYGRLAKGLVAP